MGIIETVRDIASLVQKADNIELYQKILELQVQVRDLVEENYDLRTQVREVRQQLEVQEALEFRGNVYWLRTPAEEAGPFCSKCWDVDKRTVHLHRLSDGGHWCPQCQRSAPSRGEHGRSSPVRQPPGRDPVTGY